jgi:hypothetical protein
MKRSTKREEYFQSIINTFDNKEYLTSDLKNEILKQEGGKLYKYYDFKSFFKCESKLQSFRNNKLWASVPSEFNDPFDCLNQVFLKGNNFVNKYEYFHDTFDKCKITFDGYTDVKEEKLRSFIKNLSPTTLDKLYKKDNIRLPDICDNKQITNYFQNKYYITCFTSNLRSILMWSHYAQNHTGFCLEFDPGKISFNIESKIKKSVNQDKALSEGESKVIYNALLKESCKKVDDLYPVCYFDNLEKYRDLLTDKTIHTASLLKYKDWVYENEWRIIYPKEGDDIPKDRNFFEVNPTAIYLGCDFQESGKEQKDFLEIIKAKNIDIYKMYLKNNFTLDYDRIV